MTASNEPRTLILSNHEREMIYEALGLLETSYDDDDDDGARWDLEEVQTLARSFAAPPERLRPAGRMSDTAALNRITAAFDGIGLTDTERCRVVLDLVRETGRAPVAPIHATCTHCDATIVRLGDDWWADADGTEGSRLVYCYDEDDPRAFDGINRKRHTPAL